MNELGQETKPGLFYPTVKVPADLEAFQDQMLAYGTVANAFLATLSTKGYNRVILLVRSCSLVERFVGLSSRWSSALPLASALIVTVLGLALH
jgi:hypothetical protein